MAPYRPPGRNNRSGRTQADNDIFEGLPVKQWTHAATRVSLVPPTSETLGEQGYDRWAEPPMPRDWHSLQPYTQHLLRLARSGRLGQKRKPTRDADEADAEEYGAREEDTAAEDTNAMSKGSIHGEDRAFVAKKWRHVPDHALVPEHLHLEFLARSRKGLPSFYHNLNGDAYAPIPMRKTKISRILDAETGEVAVYEILVPEGQAIENEVTEGSGLAEKEPTLLTVGTFIEGIGTANADGVLVAEIRGAAAAAQRRNRPPPKKKGGPGRGKKRVTFTNPDGSTYTTIVPNATKIVPQPGQTVKHVAKGEEAARDITAEEAANMKASGGDQDGDEENDEDEEGDEDGEDGDLDREEGEVDDGAETQTDTKPGTPQPDVAESSHQPAEEITEDAPMEDAKTEVTVDADSAVKQEITDPSQSENVPLTEAIEDPAKSTPVADTKLQPLEDTEMADTAYNTAGLTTEDTETQDVEQIRSAEEGITQPVEADTTTIDDIELSSKPEDTVE